MALKKSQLYSSLWQSCDELRGGMDASQYKDYVLTLLFMKYVSDKYAADLGALIEVPAGGGFADMARLKGDKEIGDRINKIIGRLAEANDLKGVIDQADFNDESRLGAGKEMQDRLSKLVAIFEGLDFRANRAGGDDLLGDAYEYLMRHFATESGKSKGQFYTPAEVSRVMARVVGIGPGTRPDQTIYDPTCGSGSLLLKAADEAPRGISVYGQEMDNATWALARMNMILHGHETAELRRGNTLAAPEFKHPNGGGLATFDFAVANPPFSAKAWSNGLDPAHDAFGRFEYGIPPARNGDYAFLLHLVTSLRSKGKGAIILPHGVLFRSNREAGIRRNLVRRGLVKGVIGLPANLFYGTGIPACILVVDKEHARARKGVFMLDASRGFLKDGNKNRLRAQDVHRIVDVFNRQIEVPRYSRMVPLSEIADPANDYNLNLPRYVDSSEPEDLHDLDAHLNGGIPNCDLDALGGYWEVFPSLRKALFKRAAGRRGYSLPRIEARQVKAAILGHEEFQSYGERVAAVFGAWCKAHGRRLRALGVNDRPAALIDALSEDLLARFSGLPLLNPYDVYQRLMDYWDESMQDDVHLIAAEGWAEAARPRGIVEDREKKIRETPDLTIKRRKYKMDLVPPALIAARWFAAGQADVEMLRAWQETAARELEAFVEEHTGEGGLLEDAANDKGRVTRSAVKERLEAVRDEPESGEERDALTRCLDLIEAESEAGKSVKEARDALDEKVLARYATLTESEIKTLVVEDKWFAGIRGAIDGEVQRLTQGGEGAGGAVRPAPAGAGTGGGGLRQEGRGAFEADGVLAMSRTFDFGHLVALCRRTHDETRRSATRAADTYLVTRNWLFGWYIVEYEQRGADRSKLYGKKLIERLSGKLGSSGLKGCSPTNLRKFRELYCAYPEIQQTLSVESAGKLPTEIRQTPSVISVSPAPGGQATAIGQTPSDRSTSPASDDRAAPIGPTPSGQFASPEPVRRRP